MVPLLMLMPFGQMMAWKRGDALAVAQRLMAAFGGAMLATLAVVAFVDRTAVFAALGVGLALPIVVLSFVPLLARWLPRPGAWMNTFKHLMAWPLYLTAVWLVWVLMRQAGADGTALVLLGLVVLIGALLLHGTWQLRSPSWPRRLIVLALLLLALGPFTLLQPQRVAESAQGKLWTSWSPQRLDELRREGRPVLVNMTAAWCITCLANERVALSSDAFADQLERGGVAYLKGDWTNQDPAITTYLAGFERSGVPLYVLYPRGGGAPEVLPQLLTPGVVATALTRATAGASSTPASAAGSPP
jgi:thiol:disulfide interchange protein